MPSLSASITSGCQGGAGVITLAGVQSAAPEGSVYEWQVVGAAGQDAGSVFSLADLPVVASALANDAYTVVVTATDPATSLVYRSRTYALAIACGTPLSLDYSTPAGATATTGGTLLVGGSGGVSPLNATVVELGITQPLTPNGAGKLETLLANIPAGIYTLRLTSSDGQQAQAPFTIAPYTLPVVGGCTDPSATNYNPNATQDDGSCTYAPEVRAPYFEVPPMQSLRYVVPGSTIRPPFDNVLLADEAPLDYTVEGYCQKVEQGDTLVIQCQSNYQGEPALEIRGANGVARTVPASRVQQGAGQAVSFEAYFKADPAGRTRVYFNEEALPLPFRPGQRVTLSGTGTSLDGTYPIRDVLEDAAAAVPYLVLPVAFSGTVRLDGSLTTTYAVQAFDTYQFVVDFSSIPQGCYDSRIYAIDTEFGTAEAFSEPIDVAPVHRNTVLIAYRNNDNAFNLNYSAGLVNRLRVTGRFFERQTATEKTVLRNDDSRLVLLKASAYRRVELETLLLPSWLHEQLAVALCHDFVRVDTERVTLDGDYTHEPVQRYTLARGTAVLELQSFLGAGNRDDLGDVDGGPFLIAKNSFLLARR
jgi:hypothetical protein